MTDIYENALESVKAIQSKVTNPDLVKPKVAIICGTGLGGLADLLWSDSKVEIPYGEIPHFKQSTGKEKNKNKKPFRLFEQTLTETSCWPCWKIDLGLYW